jgi:hypothetical protein
MMNALEFLRDGLKGFSATRLAFLLWVVGVLVVWVADSLNQGTLAAIDPTIVALIGILMGGKTLQRFGEK